MDDPDWIAQPLDVLLGFTPGMPLPIARRPIDRQWHPGMCRNIKTEEAHWTWVHSIWRGRHWATLCKSVMRGLKNETSLANGRALVRRLIEKGLLDMDDVPEKDIVRVEEALAYAAGLVTNKDADHKHRLVAARTLLDFLKAKPATKIDTTIKTAEDFLDDIGG